MRRGRSRGTTREARRANGSVVPSRRLPLIGLFLAFIYIAWAVPFMLESSVVAIDGEEQPPPFLPQMHVGIHGG